MKMHKSHIPSRVGMALVLGVLLLISTFVLAEDSAVTHQAQVVEDSDTLWYEFTSSCDTLKMDDGYVVIYTVCAPICSSCARVFDKEGNYLGNMKSPINTTFPEAYIENDQILWRDNDPYDYTPYD
jgi:hypothetical protein